MMQLACRALRDTRALLRLDKKKEPDQEILGLDRGRYMDPTILGL